MHSIALWNPHACLTSSSVSVENTNFAFFFLTPPFFFLFSWTLCSVPAMFGSPTTLRWEAGSLELPRDYVPMVHWIFEETQADDSSLARVGVTWEVSFPFSADRKTLEGIFTDKRQERWKRTFTTRIP
jgi:hypothetical protein